MKKRTSLFVQQDRKKLWLLAIFTCSLHAQMVSFPCSEPVLVAALTPVKSAAICSQQSKVKAKSAPVRAKNS